MKTLARWVLGAVLYAVIATLGLEALRRIFDALSLPATGTTQVMGMACMFFVLVLAVPAAGALVRAFEAALRRSP